MLTKAQETWLAHLSDSYQVKIQPYDPQVTEIFQEVKKEIQLLLGPETEVLHKGASAWGISGKGDVDIYIPVPANKFETTASILKETFGKPGSFYPLERVRWTRNVKDYEVEIFVMNKASQRWKDSLVFWREMETNPKALEQYRILKEKAEGLTVREYYREKLEFYNQVLENHNSQP